MDEFLGLSSTAWAGIYTIVTLGLLMVAMAAALYAKKQWRISCEQAEVTRKAHEEANRPYVVVSIEPSGVSQHLFDLTVVNIGQRPALDVCIRLNPLPKRAREVEGHEITKLKMLNEPVAMIAPGQKMRAFYDSHIERHGRDDLPKSHEVSLTYQDSSKRVYRETGTLDIEAMKGAMYTRVQTIHDIGVALEKISRTLRDASLLRSSGSVEVEASVEALHERQRRLAEQRAEQEEEHKRLMKRLHLDTASSSQADVATDMSAKSEES